MALVELRDLQESDMAMLFEFHRDPAAIQMAAFTWPNPEDRAAFDAQYRWIRENPVNYTQAVLWNGVFVGSVATFPLEGERFVAYWIGREYWGRGIATAALNELLSRIPERPVFAHVAEDNLGSRRVLEKCGFTPMSRSRGFAQGRGEDVDELLMQLSA